MNKEEFVKYFIEEVAGETKTEHNSKIISDAYDYGALTPLTHFVDFMTFKSFEVLIQKRVFDFYNWSTESYKKHLLETTNDFETFLIINGQRNKVLKLNNEVEISVDCASRLCAYKGLIYRYCGVRESKLFSPEFGTFIEMNNNISKTLMGFDYNLIQKELKPYLKTLYDKDFIDTGSGEETNTNINAILNQFDDELIQKIALNYINIINTCLIIKSKISKSYIDAVINPEYSNINTPVAISNDELIDLHINIERIEKRFGSELAKTVRKKIAFFLNTKVLVNIKGASGFSKVQEDLKNISETLKDKKVEIIEKIVDEFRIVSKINQILDSIDEFEADKEEVITKVVQSVIASPDTKFFSGLFELYIYLIFVKHKVEVSFLPEAAGGGRRCDFKFKNNLIADSKCLNENLNSFDNVVKKYYEDVIDQINQTKSVAEFKDSIGGSILAFYDKNFEFLKNLKEYFYKSTNDKISAIAEFIIQLNSELRKYNIEGSDVSFEKEMKNLKFILFYYVPNCTIDGRKLVEIANKQEFDDHELFFLFVTENATHDEFNKIQEVFKFLCPVIFKFPSDIKLKYE